MNEHVNDELIRLEKKEIKEQAESIARLTASPDWNTFATIIAKHTSIRTNRLITASALELAQEQPPTTSERLAGEIVGLKLALKIPELILSAQENEDAIQDTDDTIDE
jgi:hypothetical protein